MKFSSIANFFRDLMSGLRAWTVQSYTEANVKNGAQFSASTYLTNLTAGEFIDYIVITGDKPVSIKAQYVAVKNSGDVFATWYRNPTYTGGADVTAGIKNQSDINNNPTTMQLVGVMSTDPSNNNYNPDDATKVTVTDPGVQILPMLVTLGSTNQQGNSTAARKTQAGLEHILAPNTTYLYRRELKGTTESLFGFSTWYEGQLDLPRKTL
jgi:hypothetical protein